MKKILFTTIGALVALSLLCTVTACGGSTSSNASMSTANSDDSQMVITALESAQEITLKKAAISFGDSWNVKADGKEVATIKGQAFYLIGDTYSMYSTAGNFVGAEGEKFRIINHSATLYDYNGTENGAIQQEFSYPLYNFSFIDTKGEKIGSMKQEFSFGLAGTIKDAGGNSAWSFRKDLLSFGANITIKREAQSDVPAMNAVWVAVIANEISEAADS